MQAKGRKPRRNRGRQAPATAKTEKGRRTRAQLLRGVTVALSKHGYQSMKISDIAEAADVPVGLFYRYFRSKGDATLEVLQGLLEEFRSSVPAPGPDASFWERELALHQNYVRLFGEGKTALLGCYFSDTFGESAFASFFSNETRRFVREHSIAIRLAVPHRRVTEAGLRPIVLAMVSMTDNFIYRFFTGRERTPGIEGIDVGWVLAALRHRGILLTDPPTPHPVDLSGLRYVSRPKIALPRTRVEPAPLPSLAQPADVKRSDAQITLVRIKETTLRLLDRFSYDDLRIADIEAESGLTRGGVYYHFRDKRELILAVLAERLDAVGAELARAIGATAKSASAFSELKVIATVLAGQFARAPGIMRVLYNLEDRDSEVATHYALRRSDWAQKISNALASHMNLSDSEQPLLRLIGRAFLSMADRFYYETFVMRLPELAEIATTDAAAHLLAALWHRMAYRANPPGMALKAIETLRALKGR